MHKSNKTVVRQGRIYQFSVAGVDYGAFIWKVHSQFRGRVIGHPQVPQHKAPTALAVRDALLAWIRTSNDDPANAPASSQ